MNRPVYARASDAMRGVKTVLKQAKMIDSGGGGGCSEGILGLHCVEATGVLRTWELEANTPVFGTQRPT